MNKTYTIEYASGEAQEVSSKKTAIKRGDASGESYVVKSPTGVVVHEHTKPEPVKPKASPEVERAALKHTVSVTLPGNYSIVMSPFVIGLAEAYGGLATREVRFPGKLERVVEISSDNKKELQSFHRLAIDTIDDAHENLRVWQKENIERRRTLTDMQKYLEHREFLTEFGRKAARQLRKERKA